MTSACNSYKTQKTIQNHPQLLTITQDPLQPSRNSHNHPKPIKKLQWPKNRPKSFTTTQNYKQKTHYFAQKLNTVNGYHKFSAEKSEKSIQMTGWANRGTIYCQKVELESYVVIYFAKFALLAYFKIAFYFSPNDSHWIIMKTRYSNICFSIFYIFYLPAIVLENDHRQILQLMSWIV